MLVIWKCQCQCQCTVDYAGENWRLWIDASSAKQVRSLCYDRTEEGSICVVGVCGYTFCSNLELEVCIEE